MMEFHAPWPIVQSICILPSPEFENTGRLNSDVQLKKSMTGTVYTYVKRPDDQSFNFSFNLLSEKAREFLEFMETYIADQWKIVTHNGETIIGYLITNPSTLSTNGRALYGSSTEYATLSIEFKGVVQ